MERNKLEYFKDYLLNKKLLKKLKGSFVRKTCKEACDIYLKDPDLVGLRKEFPSIEYFIKIFNLGLEEIPKCPICGKIVALDTKNSSFDLKKTCGDHNCVSKLKENTCIEKFGSKENYVNYLKASFKETCNERYGVDAPAQNLKIRKRQKETCLVKYGVENALENPEIFQKMKNTMLEKYGAEYYTYTDEFKAKQEETFKNNYPEYDGVMQRVPSIRQKIETTHKNNHEGKWIFQDEDFIKNMRNKRQGREQAGGDIRDKTVKTLQSRYGENIIAPIQVPHIREKMQSRYLYEGIKFDSSWELAFYIYHKDKGSNIIKSKKYFSYKDSEGNNHRYFPDFEIDGEFYEIKGDLFIKENSEDFILTCPYKEGKKKNMSEDVLFHKTKCMKNNVNYILTGDDIKEYLVYINENYGKDYLSQFKEKK